MDKHENACSDSKWNLVFNFFQKMDLIKLYDHLKAFFSHKICFSSTTCNIWCKDTFLSQMSALKMKPQVKIIWALTQYHSHTHRNIMNQVDSLWTFLRSKSLILNGEINILYC